MNQPDSHVSSAVPLSGTVFVFSTAICYNSGMIIPTFELEQTKRAAGYHFIGGVDEAGRGPWAGPLVAAAVILAIGELDAPPIRDSKTLTAKARAKAAEWIRGHAISWAIGEVSSGEIDQLGLQLANKLAMKRAITALSPLADYILTDYVGRIAFRTPFEVIIGGDRTSLSIAAASIMAKTHRDRLMQQFSVQYPKYRFDLHKGYGTALHRELLVRHGLCPIHRRSFTPVGDIAKARESS
ncbi:MAG: ribonuclease HII [Patescibacteria group bacterium]